MMQVTGGVAVDARVAKLGSEILSRLDRLFKMHEQPLLYVANFFHDLRRRVAADAEALLAKTSPECQKAVHEKCAYFVSLLKALELECIVQLIEAKTTQEPSSKALETLVKKCEAFIVGSAKRRNAVAVFIELALEIAQETKNLERSIFGSDFIFYMPSQNGQKLGELLTTGDDSKYADCNDNEKINLEGLAFFSPSLRKEVDVLEVLNLSGKLTGLLDAPNLFSSIPRLREVNLSRNQLKFIAPYVFDGVRQLEVLDLSVNSLAGADIAFLLRDLVSLRSLSLRGNGISRLDLTQLFKSCPLLAHLDLSYNQLDSQSINETAFDESLCLQELNLASNLLDKMDFFRSLPYARQLDLSGNKIRTLTDEVLAQLSAGTLLLNLANNPLQPLIVAFLKELPLVQL